MDMLIIIVDSAASIASILCLSKLILIIQIKLVCRYVQRELGLLTIQLLIIVSINALHVALQDLQIIFRAGA